MKGTPDRRTPAGFDPSKFQRPGLSHNELCDMKEIFDVFDIQRTGLVKISGTISPIQT